MIWWYALANKKFGPVTLENLQELLLKNTITSKTLLWKEGMQEWLPLESLDEFRNINLILPPPLPLQEEVIVQAGYWSRFFARIFDITFESLIFSLPLGILLAYFVPSFSTWIQQDGASQAFGLLCFPLTLFFDALIYKLCGNTLGKALLGIKIFNETKQPLTFKQYLKHNFRVWVEAFAFGIPFLNLLTMLYQARQVSMHNQTTYDKFHNFQVLQKPFNWLKLASFIILLISISFLTSVIIRFGDYKNREALSLNTKTSSTSTSNHPLTLREARLKNPQYNDLSAKQLADTLYSKYYSSMSREDFYKAFQLELFETTKYKELCNSSKKLIATAYFMDYLANAEYFQLNEREQKRILDNFLNTYNINTQKTFQESANCISAPLDAFDIAHKQGFTNKEIFEYFEREN